MNTTQLSYVPLSPSVVFVVAYWVMAEERTADFSGRFLDSEESSNFIGSSACSLQSREAVAIMIAVNIKRTCDNGDS